MKLHTETPLTEGLERLFIQLETRLGLDRAVNAYLAGGMTVHHIRDAIGLDPGLNFVRVHVLAPGDLAVSKMARSADNDKEDIAALVQAGLTTADNAPRPTAG